MIETINDILVESNFHMPHNSPHLETIENSIAQIQNGDGSKNEALTRRIQLALNKEFNCNCQGVYILDNNMDKYFFGACIIPTEDECYKIIDNMVRADENIKFERCSSFVINIDSKLLYDVCATPREVTAVLLHEIGHKAFSAIKKVELKQKLIYSSMEQGVEPSQIREKYIACKGVLMTPVINMFTSSFTSIGLIKEIGADSFAIRYGYGRDLADLLAKLKEIDSRRSLFVKGRKSDDDALMKWSIDNMINFSMRRKSILRTLERQNDDSNFIGVNNLIKSQINKLKNTRVSFKGLQIANKLKSESFKSFVDMKTKGMSQLELDELAVEIDRIEYHEDKAYLINRIHKDISDCDKQIAKLQNTIKKTGGYNNNIKLEELKKFRNELVELTNKVKSTKIVEKDFDLRVEYPEGYKG